MESLRVVVLGGFAGPLGETFDFLVGKGLALAGHHVSLRVARTRDGVTWQIAGPPLKDTDLVVALGFMPIVPGKYAAALIAGDAPRRLPYDIYAAPVRAGFDSVHCPHVDDAQRHVYRLPLAFDPQVHAPIERDADAREAVFIGRRRGDREWLEPLRRAGIIACHGPGWPTGYLAMSQARGSILPRTRIGADVKHPLDTCTLRLFELAAMGVPVLSNSWPIGATWEPNREFFAFSGPHDFRARLAEVLALPDEELACVARQGREAVQGHTYEAMARVLVRDAMAAAEAGEGAARQMGGG